MIYIIDKDSETNNIIKKYEKEVTMKKKNEITIRSSAAEYLTFIAATGDDKEAIEVRYEDENIWLTQKMLSTLYKVEINTINYHIKKYIMIMN